MTYSVFAKWFPFPIFWLQGL